ncbi:hypothetical protein RVR34_04335 [Microcystis aeruginosa FBCC-A68]|uniref:hypothetical protein n=1 Tax=Microcystis aeruginosa TaxID=1126 RepID=UPI0014830593|nr:hypothetical protein [Microcystis aeruginosa]
MPIVFNLERANQLSLLPDKDLADLCPLIEAYQVTKNQSFSVGAGCGVLPIFREKVPKFPSRSLQWLALFDFKKA